MKRTDGQTDGRQCVTYVLVGLGLGGPHVKRAGRLIDVIWPMQWRSFVAVAGRYRQQHDLSLEHQTIPFVSNAPLHALIELVSTGYCCSC